MKKFFRHSAQLALASTALLALAHVAAAADTPANSAEQHNNDVVVQQTDSQSGNGVTSTVDHSTITTVAGGSNTVDNSNIGHGEHTTTTTINGQLIDSHQDSFGASTDQSHDGQSSNHSSALSDRDTPTTPGATANINDTSSARSAVITSSILHSSTRAGAPIATTMPQPPTASTSLPGNSSSTPASNLPFNPLASTGLLLNLGQIGTFTQSLAKSFSTFIPATIASKVAGTVLNSKTKQILNWLLLVAAVLMAGIVAMWRRSGFSHAPRAGLINQFRLFTKASSGGIVSNSLFCVLNFGGI